MKRIWDFTAKLIGSIIMLCGMSAFMFIAIIYVIDRLQEIIDKKHSKKYYNTY